MTDSAVWCCFSLYNPVLTYKGWILKGRPRSKGGMPKVNKLGQGKGGSGQSDILLPLLSENQKN